MIKFKAGDLYYVARYKGRITQVKITHSVEREEKEQVVTVTKDGNTLYPPAKDLYRNAEDLIQVIRESITYFNK